MLKMIEPAFDNDGYPTELTLALISNWQHARGFRGLMEYVRLAWKHGDVYFHSEETEEGTLYELHTTGWSGNEELIAALQKNSLFWVLHWQESGRGGHYKFLIGK